MSRAAIEAIEDSPFAGFDKPNLLLVYLGLKAGSSLILKSLIWREGNEEQHVPQEHLAAARKSLLVSGLAYQEDEPRLHPAPSKLSGPRRYQELVDFTVAQDEASLQRLIQARQAGDQRSIGLALGFPETAATAFAEGRRIERDDLPMRVRLSNGFQFLNFVLSDDHWQEELAVVEGWVTAIEAASTLIYVNILHQSDLAVTLRRRLVQMLDES